MKEKISLHQRGALKLKDAADYLSLSPVSLRRLIDRGILKANQKTRHLLIPMSELQRFLSE